jgi:hypothetical protein
MALYFSYNQKTYSKVQFIKQLERIKSLGFDGLFFSVANTNTIGHSKKERKKLPFWNMIAQIRSSGLKTGIKLQCFQNRVLYQNDSFIPPMNYLGATYFPKSDYYPVCPNNPDGLQTFYNIIDLIAKNTLPDFIYLEYFRFPFYWEKEELDIQNRIPPFCYCPFCVTEFSSVVGEIVSTGEQIQSMMPEWLEWRTEVMFSLLSYIQENVPNDVQIIVALPPLSLIDLPFTTGQLPQGLIEKGCLLSPQLHHRVKTKNLAWIEDLLDQYQLDLRIRRLFPSFEYGNAKEFEYLAKLERKYSGIIFCPLPDAM